MPNLLAPLVWGAAGLAALGLCFCMLLRRQIAGALGAVQHAVRPASPARKLSLAIWVAALGALLFVAPELRAPALLLLASALGIHLARPGFEDSVYGASGVQRGWFARRFEDLDEWRLTGQHLRWKLYGDWQATEVPPGEHDGLRARLMASIPERESAFKR